MDTIHDEGWIKLYRKSIDSQVFQSEGLWKIWTWCLLKANHEDRWVSVKTGKATTEVFVKRGQFIFGRKTAAKELRMVESTVHKRIAKLKSMRNCDIQSNTHYSIVTILNYELYQGTDKEEVTGNNHGKGLPVDEFKNTQKSDRQSDTQDAMVTSQNDELFSDSHKSRVTSKVTGKWQASNTNKNDKNKKNNNGRSKKETDPRVREFSKVWEEAFQRETESPYVFAYGKDGALIKKLLRVHSLETLHDVVTQFFRDEQCRRRGLTIGIFFQEVNRLIGIKAMDPLEQVRRERRQKEARN